MTEEVVTNTPGFQKTETTSAEVIIYPHGQDPIVINSNDKVEPTGRSRTDDKHSLVSVSTNKMLSGSAGTFTIQIKPSRGVDDTLFEQLIDDDWVDIVFRKHRRTFHVMRGLIDSIRRSETVSGTGATSTMFTITGRDFQKVWESTPIWFNKFTIRDAIDGAAGLRILSGLDDVVNKTPDVVVKAYLEGFLEQLQGSGQANWRIPLGIPNTNATFIDSFDFYDQLFFGQPERASVNINLAMRDGPIWSLAKEWSDPMFCELYTELLQDGEYPQPEQEVPLDTTKMSVIFRDKPFPIIDEEIGTKLNLPTGKGGLWFAIPQYTVTRQQIVNTDIGRTGQERYNAFYLSPQLVQEQIGVKVDLSQPLWDPDDVAFRGIRRFDITTKYKLVGNSLVSVIPAQRKLLRDWYAISPYLLNGTISLGIGRPDIRIGTKVRIPGNRGPSQDETYYVEGVNHTWAFGAGMKTNLTCTRGWKGTDDSLLDAMKTLNDRYVLPGKQLPRDATAESLVDDDVGFA